MASQGRSAREITPVEPGLEVDFTGHTAAFKEPGWDEQCVAGLIKVIVFIVARTVIVNNSTLKGGEG